MLRVWGFGSEEFCAVGMYWALRLGLRWHLARAASKQDVTERSVLGPVVDLPSQGTGMCSASYPFGQLQCGVCRSAAIQNRYEGPVMLHSP